MPISFHRDRSAQTPPVFVLSDNDWERIEVEIEPLLQSWGYIIDPFGSGKVTGSQINEIHRMIKTTASISDDAKSFFSADFDTDFVLYTHGD